MHFRFMGRSVFVDICDLVFWVVHFFIFYLDIMIYSNIFVEYIFINLLLFCIENMPVIILKNTFFYQIPNK